MSALHPNIDTLRAIYSDLRCIDRYAAPDIVLHTADRGASGGPAQVCGREAVKAKELELIRLSGDSLVMDVHSIVANDYFGAVLGVLRARAGDRTIGMPFCGLWRFRDGLVVEHWENAYDAQALGSFLTGRSSDDDWVTPAPPRAVQAPRSHGDAPSLREAGAR